MIEKQSLPDPAGDPSDLIREGIEEASHRAAKRRTEVIDQVCEMALQGGEYGVAVYRDVVMVDPKVPYGAIHFHQDVYPEGESVS